MNLITVCNTSSKYIYICILEYNMLKNTFRLLIYALQTQIAIILRNFIKQNIFFGIILSKK